MNTNSLPTLYNFRRCPYAMRARMAICASGIDVKVIEVSLKNKPQELLNYSPKATVPVLVTADGKVLEESRDIIIWALQQNDPYDWLWKSQESQLAAMNKLMDQCDKEFKPWLDRYKYFDRHTEHSQLFYRQKAEDFIAHLNNLLINQVFLMDEKIRLVDIAIFPFIRQFAAVDVAWFENSIYTHVIRWLQTCINMDIFKTIMEKNYLLVASESDE